MEIRAVEDRDITAIVSLLKMSLGESLMPKSEGYWRWKHLDNPFGSSPVLVCYEGAELIGVRAFMRWQWRDATKTYNAVRAVDTATHPAYQGKGIFKKLTLSLVENCKRSGEDFVFNTPNGQSMPGYLKMGWSEVGRLPVTVKIIRPFAVAANLIRKSVSPPGNVPTEGERLSSFIEHPGLASLIEQQHLNSGIVRTKLSTQYLRWRYISVPVANYVVVTEQQGNELSALLIGRIKNTRLGREFRITDYMKTDEKSAKRIMDHLRHKCEVWKCDYIAWSGGGRHWKGLMLNRGPMVTVRGLVTSDLGGFLKFNNWSPTLGDLELF